MATGEGDGVGDKRSSEARDDNGPRDMEYVADGAALSSEVASGSAGVVVAMDIDPEGSTAAGDRERDGSVGEEAVEGRWIMSEVRDMC